MIVNANSYRGDARQEVSGRVSSSGPHRDALLEALGHVSVFGPCGPLVQASDDYNLLGPGDDDRHAFEAVLQVDATIEGSGVGFAQLDAS